MEFRIEDHTFLVTGATGFVGSHIAKALCERGAEVHIIRRNHSDIRLISNLPIIHHIGDVTIHNDVKKAMSKGTAVFHCAGLVSFWKKLRKKQYDVNVNGTEVVSSIALEMGIQRFVHTSSVAALGPASDGQMITEETPFGWDHFDIGYNISKHEAEIRIIEKVKNGLNAVIVNPSTIVGPQDIHLHGTSLLLNVMKKRLPVYIETFMDIVDIDDVINGHIKAFERGKTGERYLLSGNSLPLSELCKKIESIAGGRAPRLKIPYNIAYFAANFIEMGAALINKRPLVTRELLRVGKHRRKFSSAKAERELGYTKTPLEVTIEKTARWLKDSYI